MNLSKLVLFLAAAIALSGCSIRGSIDNLTEVTSKNLQGQQQGFSSGAISTQVVNGYSVSASLGSYTDGIQQTQNGYTIYSGLQGSTSSEVTVEE